MAEVLGALQPSVLPTVEFAIGGDEHGIDADRVVELTASLLEIVGDHRGGVGVQGIAQFAEDLGPQLRVHAGFVEAGNDGRQDRADAGEEIVDTGGIAGGGPDDRRADRPVAEGNAHFQAMIVAGSRSQRLGASPIIAGPAVISLSNILKAATFVPGASIDKLPIIQFHLFSPSQRTLI